MIMAVPTLDSTELVSVALNTLLYKKKTEIAGELIRRERKIKKIVSHAKKLY